MLSTSPAIPWTWPLPRIIGLCGPRRAGKDTIARVLVQTEDYQPLTLATPLMALAQQLWPDGFPRDAVQALGATIRAHDPLALIHVITRIIDQSNPTARWIITDIRLPLEWKTFRTTYGAGFAGIHVTASLATRRQRIAASHRTDGLRETATSGQDVTEQWVDQPPPDAEAIWDTTETPPDHAEPIWTQRLHDPAWWAQHPLARR